MAVLIYLVLRVLSAGGAVCNATFPARDGGFASYWYVFVAILAFAFGHLTDQRRIRARKLPQDELGTGQWSSSRAAVAVNLAVAVFLYLVTALMVVEALTLWRGVWPITYYTRCSNDAAPLVAVGAVAVYSWIVGRWLWVFK